MDIDGIEFLKQEGLDKVSNKTFINQENLTYLLDKDFEKLNQTKAIGFIQILEREYPVDLSDLRSEYLAYIRVNKPKDQYLIIDEYDDESEFDRKKYLPYLLLLLALGLGWYMFSSTSSEDFVYQSDLNVVKNSTVSQKAKENLSLFPENNMTNKIEKDSLLELSLDSEDKNLSAQIAKERALDLDLNNAVEELFPSASSDINQSSNDLNNSNVVDVDSIIGVDVEDAGSKSSSNSQIYIRPRQKVWIGLFYLDNKKRKDLLVKEELKLDMSRDQLILTGHSNFRVFNNDEKIKVKSRNSVRFILHDGKLEEISKIEYNRYKKGE